jgi:protein involved in polysaccharide export with SLBB domain
MKFMSIRVWIFCWIVAFAVTSHAATNDNIRMNWDNDSSGGGVSNILPAGSQTPTGNVSDEILLRLLENRRDQKNLDDLVNGSRVEQGNSGTGNIDSRVNRAKNAQVIVTAVPGDGLVKLAWKLVNRPEKSGSQDLRFSIRIGVESEKLTKTVHVGNSDSYVLRELKNNQPYYVQIVASDRDQLVLYKSEEIRIMSQSAEELGSRLEKAFSKKTQTLLDKNEPEQIVRTLNQFGYDFFKNSSQLQGALDSLPVGNDYILGPGDTLSLNVWGAVNSRHELTVDRNGEIMIPKIGVVKVWGLSYEQGRDVINKAIGRLYKNYEMSITLGRLRTIQVFVVGEVEAPGSYSVSSLSTVINALSAAGGPSRNGSLRTIRISRNGQSTVSKIPLDNPIYGYLDRLIGLKLLTSEAKEARPYTKAEAARFVREAEKNIALNEKSSPAVAMELVVRMRELLPREVAQSGMAGKGQSYENGLAVREVDLYEMFLSGDRSKDVRLQNGDTVFVPVIGSVVAVAGEVKRPAIYEIGENATLPEVLRMAGGVTATGYTGRIQVERVKNNSSRIVLDYEPKDGSIDAALGTLQVMDRDMIKVFPVHEAVRQIVSLKGNVVRAGEYQFRKGMRLSDLIPGYQALLPESYLESVEITRLAPPDFHRELLTANLRRAVEGSEPDNILLQEQDVVKVFSRWEMEEKPRVSVNGAVVNPGTFDYYPGMTVRDLITAAGSPKRNAFLETGELSRIVIVGDKASPSRLSLNLSKALAGDPGHNLPLQSDDVLIVRSVTDWFDASDKFIKLKGEVRFPGVYSVVRGEKISSVIERAGGYTERAYLRGAKFLRRSVRESQQLRMNEIVVRTEKEILQKQSALALQSSSREELDATKASLDGLLKSVELMKTMKAEGRVVIRLTSLDQLQKSSFDVVVEGGDELEVPARPSVVHVMGQVFNPISLVHQPEASDLGSYLKKAGGPTNDADESEMYVIKTDGTVFSRQQSSFGLHWSDDDRRWTFGSFKASTLEPGDTLVVPQKIERIAWMREIKDITSILANVALTAGTVLIGIR